MEQQIGEGAECGVGDDGQQGVVASAQLGQMAGRTAGLLKQLLTALDLRQFQISRCRGCQSRLPELHLIPVVVQQLGTVTWRHGKAKGLHRRAVLLDVQRRGHAHVAQKSRHNLLANAGLIGLPAKTSQRRFLMDVVAHVIESAIQALRFLSSRHLLERAFRDRFQKTKAKNHLRIAQRCHGLLAQRSKAQVFNPQLGAAQRH